MSDTTTYTLGEIVERTGFDKRTTSYYVQKGLLPKVGRRGPKTRYPQAFLNRLLFIKLMREKQDRGEIGHLTLTDLRDLLDRVRPETIADMVNGRESLHKIAAMEMNQPAVREPVSLPGFHDEKSDVIEVTIDDPDELSRSANPNAVAQFEFPEPEQDSPVEKPVVRAAAEAEETAVSNGFSHVEPEDRLGWSLARLQKAVDKPRRNRGTTESWHRARITPELTISARNLTDDDVHLLDAAARMLKQMLWQAWEE